MAATIDNDIIKAVRSRYRKVRDRVPIESGNYPYVTARVKAKKALLYSKDVYEKMLHMEIPEIARFIGEGEYKKELLLFGARFSGVDLIEKATAENMARIFTQIIDFSEGHLKVMVRAFLDHWDVMNIKTILRAKLYGVPTQELIDRLVPAGGFTEKYLCELAGMATMEDIFASLEGTRYQRALSAIGKEPKDLTNLAEYEDSLSRLYYEELLDAIPPTTFGSQLFRRFVKRDIDLLNLKTLLRLWAHGLRPERDVFLDGGLEMRKERLGEMLTMDQAAIAAALSGFEFYHAIADEFGGVKEHGVSSLIRELEKERSEHASEAANINPLSVIPVLLYIVLKEREVQNLTIIARGKQSGLSLEVIKSLLVA